MRSKFGIIALIAILLMAGAIFAAQIDGNAPLGALLAPFGVVLALGVFLSFLHVRVMVGEHLSVRFFPFPDRIIAFQEILSVAVVQYRPIRDYGGWGLKWGRNGTAYTISGNIGVKVELSNGRHIMVDCPRPAALRDAIQEKIHG